MSKNEFLKILRQSLEGEVDNNTLEQSVKFYDEYISNNSEKSEEELIKEIGDPRLIAKTIIETEKVSSSSENNNQYENYEDNNDYNRTPNNKVYHLKWYHMVVILLVLLLLFSFIVRLGWILVRLIFTFFVPIIFVVLLWAMFRRR